MCDIWKTEGRGSVSLEDLKRMTPQFTDLGVEEFVLTGGEPLMNREIDEILPYLAKLGRIRLVTNGMLLSKHVDVVTRSVSSIRISLDGPPEIHNRIRGVASAFKMLERGMAAIRERNGSLRIGARCTIQRENFRYMEETVATARRLGFTYLSFNGTDVTSEAYNRTRGEVDLSRDRLALSPGEIAELDASLDHFFGRCAPLFDSGFIAETPDRVRNILTSYYRDLSDETGWELSPCNAPWVSAVIHPNGSILPCFFHQTYGSLDSDSLKAVLNKDSSREFRKKLDVDKNPVCRHCVCRMPLYTCDCGWSVRGQICDGQTCQKFSRKPVE